MAPSLEEEKAEGACITQVKGQAHWAGRGWGWGVLNPNKLRLALKFLATP